MRLPLPRFRSIMKVVNGRILKSFVWIICVSVIVVVMTSMRELMSSRQKIKIDVDPHVSVKATVAPPQKPIYIENPPPKTEEPTKSNTPPGPATHIGFLKVHKAASTTTQGIFLRFGWRRNLTFVLSPEYNRFGYPNIISTNESITKYNTLPPPPGRSFEILCNHVVYGKEEWSLVLPPDSAIVGTVREPFSHFTSILNYFNPRSIAAIKDSTDPVDPVGTFLRNPQKYENKNIRLSFTNNRLAFEYGVHPEIIMSRDYKAFDKYLKEVLDKEFTVVIVADKFDESLVLMKRKLNWSLMDIVYALKNVRSSSKANRYEMREEHKPLHKNLSSFDYLLYDFFKNKLDKQMAKEGPDFIQEVENFKEVRKYIENFCHSVPKHVKSIKIDQNKWSPSFDITREDCDLMHKGEIAFVQMIRKEQYGSATWGVAPQNARPNAIKKN